MELELKYRAPADGDLDRLAILPGLGPATLGSVRARHETDRYLDTMDRRLSSERWACRLRTSNGRTIVSLKGPADAAVFGDPQAMHRRPEVEGPALASLDPATWPPSAARDRLDALSAGQRLHERLRLEQDRRERAVRIDARRIGVLSIDRVELWVGSQPVGRLFAVELELDPASTIDPEIIDALDGSLRAAGGLQPDPLSKLEHALALIDEAA